MIQYGKTITNLSELWVSSACKTLGTRSTGSTSKEVPLTASAGEPILALLLGGWLPNPDVSRFLSPTPAKA